MSKFLSAINHLFKSLVYRTRDESLPKEGQAVKEFWESAHELKSHLWLTGSEPKTVLQRLGVSSIVTDLGGGKGRILDVGVGEGQMGRHLKSLGIHADALDISEAGLQRVAGLYSSLFSGPELLPESHYDLILHHLVAQHMSHADLALQLTHLTRALRPNGILALQYSTDPSNSVSPDPAYLQKQGGVQRNPEWFAQQLAGHIDLSFQDSEGEFWPNSGTGFRILSVRRSSPE